jgi:hypothetical protein
MSLSAFGVYGAGLCFTLGLVAILLALRGVPQNHVPVRFMCVGLTIEGLAFLSFGSLIALGAPGATLFAVLPSNNVPVLDWAIWVFCVICGCSGLVMAIIVKLVTNSRQRQVTTWESPDNV